MPKAGRSKIGDEKKQRVGKIVRALAAKYPNAPCALNHQSPFQLLAATILSAQCTDERVNLVTPALFARYPAAMELSKAKQADLEEIIRSTGFFRNKATNLIGMARAVVNDYQGELPRTLEELVRLPGVGRKTANVVLGNAFDIPGLVVDTHVTRLSNRLGLAQGQDAVKLEYSALNL